MYCQRISLTMVRDSVVWMTGLDFSWIITFCSDVGNFRVRSLALGSLCFLVTVVKPVSMVLAPVTVAQKAGAGLAVVGARVGVA